MQMHVIRKLRRFLPLGLLVLMLALGITAPSPALADKTPKCGGIGEKICPPEKATKVGKAMTKCPKGTFFDVSTFSCWSCPSGYKRTIFGIKDKKACEKPAHTSYDAAKKKRKGFATDCHKHEFWDGKGGKVGACWKCPDGFKRGIEKVDGKKACIKISSIKHAKADKAANFKPCAHGFFDPRNKGECWKCPSDYFRNVTKVTGKDACLPNPAAVCDGSNVDVRGKCYKKNDCGKDGQRPCLVVERVPSCNKGLMEEIITNKCMKPQQAMCVGISKLAKAALKGGNKLSKAEKAAAEEAAKAVKTVMKTILGKKAYKDFEKATSKGIKDLAKKADKEFKKNKDGKKIMKDIDKFVDVAGQMAPIVTKAHSNQKKLMNYFADEENCFKSKKQAIATVKNLIGDIPDPTKLLKLSMAPHHNLTPWYNNLLIKSAHAGEAPWPWYGDKNYFRMGFAFSGTFIGGGGVEVFFVTDFKDEFEVFLDLSFIAGITKGASGELTIGIAMADGKIEDVGGWGGGFSFGTTVLAKVFGLPDAVDLGMNFQTTPYINGAKPRLNGVVVTLGLRGGQDAVVADFVVDYGHSFHLTK